MFDGPSQSAKGSDSVVLALRPKDAAKALGLGERKLWELTNRREIPHVRIGKAVLYPVEGLREWLRRQQKGGEA